MRALNFPAGRGASAALMLLALLAGPAVADPERRLDEVRRRLDATAAEQGEAQEGLRRARGDLEAVDGRRRRAIADLRAVERRQAELAERVAAVEADLAAAEQDLTVAEGRLAETTEALADGEARLRRTRVELERRRARFSARVRAAYMHGGGGYASLALDLEDAAAVGRGLAYMERVVDHDQTTVAEIADLQREVEEQIAAIGGLRERQTAQRAVAERERDRLADVLVEQEALADQVAAEAERHRRLITDLEADRDSYLVLVDDLEAQSAALETELADLAAEESDAREEVRRAEQERRERREAEQRAREEAEERARAEAEERARRAAEEDEARRAAAAAPEPRRTDKAREGSRAARSSPASSPSPSAPPSPSPTSETGTARLARPVAGPITSGFGYRTHPIHGDRRLHAGIDFGAPHGSRVSAAAGGSVVSAGDRGGYGLAVVVDHGGGLTTLYAHLSGFAVSAGQRVTAGQALGAVGSTGFSTGPHLHFEVRVNGEPRDPAGYL